MKRLSLVATLLTWSATVWVTPVNANPGISLTQRDGRVDMQTCLDRSKRALQILRFTDIRSGTTHVEGNLRDYAVLITCYEVASAQGVTVQSIVIAGPNSQDARDLGGQLLETMP